MARKKMYAPRDRRVFRKTSGVKKANMPGHIQPRGGQCL